MAHKGYAVLAGLCLALSGCGTTNTVLRGDEVTRRNLKEWKTYCDSVPRVYSGVSYGLCILHGPSPTVSQDIAASALLPLRLLDFVPSASADTVVLPYTIYRQSTEGSITLAR